MEANIQPLDRVFLELGPLTIYWYGVIIGAGVLLALYIATKESTKRGLPKDTFIDLVLFAVPIAIICARIYYVAFEWDYYSQHLNEIPQIWNGGIAIHGGLIGAILTGIVFSRVKKISFWKLADIAAPSIILGQAIGRWGNFMNQEAHGGEVSRAFLEGLHLPEFIINQMYINGTYYHPTFLYESLWNLAGFALLIALRRVNLRRGELFLTYVIWYSIGRYFIEGMRTDSLMLTDTLRIAQVISLVLIAVAVIIIAIRRKTNKETYLETSKKKQG
ncbi:prolipoprotein diacylglyceryl transferase [Priestia flexa]|jgi:phosphatidylglycerol---prolipoprotein diacylglyceryl transferase|uniref:Phosphatidylglycerol--prolipoprotein diacylglyceryl transferase n=2 Tax=Priestia TaxID=2800373 RepID=A0A0V8JLU5_9BACI|nr:MULTISPECIES: prolipoprotein diacylglyceryl transferase [Bacillaceae]KSU87916.1 prolipoprotein diacylglyceryl transferase [Priestia veravalensis]KZB91659.1 prolipoprotein diacylglyceryl transferase [Bacillus sp. VT 712]MBN8253018.1 prolipoprotein diacylglyceryl transferase [Priestia flexa]MBN8433660.1 prolipoprotein diacylglyceryl transferase [Priestia flexa]MCA0966082.1 prolipoprotein diacylglyceryl transferase [Priestia flexa]